MPTSRHRHSTRKKHSAARAIKQSPFAERQAELRAEAESVTSQTGETITSSSSGPNWLVLGVVAFVLVAAVLFYTRSNSSSPQPAPAAATTNQTTPPPPANPEVKTANPTPTPTTPAAGLKVEDVKVGTGTEATTGKSVTVHYTGTLTDGTKFDSSLDSKQPLTFTLGTNGIIQGWNQGILGMKVGGKRKLVIPPDLAYGAQGRGPKIPPHATLNFDIELLDVK
ncbi:MAG: FKBP-type peptidyl-prolyl cis-trans isomerase [Blastocatellia bacterium]|nr:FKBP-type peptidyl-prolyl cis-trans isomerase [Blastocatellia bacterium]